MNTAELKAAAHAAWEDDNEQEAETLFTQVLAIDEHDAQAHFDLALLYKFQQRWALAQVHNARALAIKPDDDAACWNLGIAATAQSDWPVAAQAWERFGVTLDLSQTPPVQAPAAAAVRIRHEQQIDVVEGVRLDPARVQVTRLPLPDTGVRFGDILLNDGLGNGSVEIDGVAVAVREHLGCWQVSDYATYVLEVVVPSAGPLQELASLAARAGLPCADWGGKVRYVLPTEGKHALADPEWQAVREIGVAALADQPVADLLEAWLAACPDVEVREVYLALAPEDAQGDA